MPEKRRKWAGNLQKSKEMFVDNDTDGMMSGPTEGPENGSTAGQADGWSGG